MSGFHPSSSLVFHFCKMMFLIIVLHVQLAKYSHKFSVVFAGWFNYIVLLIAAVQCELPLSRGPSATNLPGILP